MAVVAGLPDCLFALLLDPGLLLAGACACLRPSFFTAWWKGSRARRVFVAPVFEENSHRASIFDSAFPVLGLVRFSSSDVVAEEFAGSAGVVIVVVQGSAFAACLVNHVRSFVSLLGRCNLVLGHFQGNRPTLVGAVGTARMHVWHFDCRRLSHSCLRQVPGIGAIIR